MTACIPMLRDTRSWLLWRRPRFRTPWALPNLETFLSLAGSIMMSEFPTAPAFGHTQAAAARDKVTLRTPRQFSVLSAIKAFNAEDAEKISRRSQRRPIPRVRAETLAPPIQNALGTSKP